MAQEIRGDLHVRRTINADRRVNQGLSRETLTAARTVTVNDFSWLQLINATTQDVVLPDATLLTNGWSLAVGIDASSAAAVAVKTYHATLPVLLKTIPIDKAYRLTLIDNATPAGVWQLHLMAEADIAPAVRFVDTFNATSDWTGPTGGYYSRTVAQTTHLMGTSPTVKVRSGAGPYVNVEPDQISVAANGNITIQVPNDPDLRFIGQMIIL